MKIIMTKNAYAQSGVDVEAGYEVVERIKKHVARIFNILMRTYRFIIGVRRSFSHQGSSSYSVKRKKQVLFELFFSI